MSKRFYSFSFFIFIFFISLPIFVSAVQVMVPGSADVQKTTVPEFIANLYNFAIYFGGALAVLMIIAGAVYYTFSAATPSQKGRGMDMVWGALWGLGLLLGAYLILKTVNPELILLRGPGGEVAKDVNFNASSTSSTQGNATSEAPPGSVPVVTTGQNGQLTFNFAEDQAKKEDQIPFFIKNFYSFSLYLAGSAAIIMLVVGGIYYLVSAASPSGKGQGKEIVIGAALGLLLIVGSYLILKTVNPELVNLQNPGGDLARDVSYESCKAPEENSSSTGSGSGGITVSSNLKPCELYQSPFGKDGECVCYVTKKWEETLVAFEEQVQNEEDPNTTDIINGALLSKGQQCFLDTFGKSSSEVQKKLVTITCAGIKIQIHELAKAAFETACNKIPSTIKTKCDGKLVNSGTFVWRKIAGSNSLSNHSFGAALDISAWACGYCDNVSKSNCYDYTNKRICKPPAAQGSCNNPNLPTAVINAFKGTPGFRWGGDYGKKTDNMHFEWLGPCAK
jgi:hypothetical protein